MRTSSFERAIERLRRYDPDVTQVEKREKVASMADEAEATAR
jgi:hypothetical protein